MDDAASLITGEWVLITIAEWGFVQEDPAVDQGPSVILRHRLADLNGEELLSFEQAITTNRVLFRLTAAVE